MPSGHKGSGNGLTSDLADHYLNLWQQAEHSAMGIVIVCEPMATRAMLYRVRNLYGAGRWSDFEVRSPPRDARNRLWIRRRKDRQAFESDQQRAEGVDDSFGNAVISPDLANALDDAPIPEVEDIDLDTLAPEANFDLD